ncbi:MAG: tRNA (adenosine(37)-N6)-threonylcarbamoyltransferase complex dimerization subunit type 1 TsaB [Myxococcaceae bacterium]
MLLALDTSTLTLSLCLARVEDGRAQLIEQVTKGPPLKQSELLPGEVGDLLRRHNLTFKDLTGLVVGRGPGSFTGLRIGISAVKAFAYAESMKVAAVSSLAALAHQAYGLSRGGGVDPTKEIWAISVARINDLYVGTYRRNGHRLQETAPEDAMTPAELAEKLNARPNVLVVGPALPGYGPKLLEHGAPATALYPGVDFPSAVALAELALLPEKVDLDALFALEPHYVRPSEAERNPKFPPLPGPPPKARLKED